MKKITTALFDLDGVLIKSGPLITAAFAHTLARFKTGLGPQDVMDGGSTIKEVYSKIASPEALPDFVQAHADFQADNLHLVTAFDDAVSTLKALREKGISIGIITNRSINARHIIEHCELADLVDLVVSVEDVVNPKPHPEGIQKAMGHFRSKPTETVMIGDMPVDIQAGKAAGVMTIGIDTSDCLQKLQESKPDHIVASLSEVIPLILG